MASPHIPFVYNSWLRSYRHGSSFAKPIESRLFYDRHHQIISRILDRPSTKVFVASPKEDPETFIGYLVVEEGYGPAIVHFCYVKRPFRRLGVAKALCGAAGLNLNQCVYTHRTYDLESLESRYPGLSYDPYLI